MVETVLAIYMMFFNLVKNWITGYSQYAAAVFCCKKKLYEPSAIVKGMLSSPSDAGSVKSRLNILLKCLSTPDDSDEIGAINELLKNLSGDL